MEVNTSSTTDPINMYNYLNNFVLNPIVFFIILLVIISYLIFFSNLGNNGTDQNFSMNSSDTNYSNWQSILGILIVLIVIVLILINAFQYFFSINLTAYLNDLFTSQPKVDVLVKNDYNLGKKELVIDSNNLSSSGGSSRPERLFRSQVFNIPGNNYNYEDAKTLCQAYDATLATYDQIEDAYKNGGEWCNYGWSAGQMALFPTQETTFNNLQKIKGHEHDCGRPGVNGGYIANPNVKFGVNCYGKKPRISHEESELMKVSSPYPKTLQDIQFQQKVDYWKNNIVQVLISPFNHNTWGQV
jgi:hypothetical protein